MSDDVTKISPNSLETQLSEFSSTVGDSFVFKDSCFTCAEEFVPGNIGLFVRGEHFSLPVCSSQLSRLISFSETDSKTSVTYIKSSDIETRNPAFVLGLPEIIDFCTQNLGLPASSIEPKLSNLSIYTKDDSVTNQNKTEKAENFFARLLLFLPSSCTSDKLSCNDPLFNHPIEYEFDDTKREYNCHAACFLADTCFFSVIKTGAQLILEYDLLWNGKGELPSRNLFCQQMKRYKEIWETCPETTAFLNIKHPPCDEASLERFCNGPMFKKLSGVQKLLQGTQNELLLFIAMKDGSRWDWYTYENGEISKKYIVRQYHLPTLQQLVQKQNGDEDPFLREELAFAQLCIFRKQTFLSNFLQDFGAKETINVFGNEFKQILPDILANYQISGRQSVQFPADADQKIMKYLSFHGDFVVKYLKSLPDCPVDIVVAVNCFREIFGFNLEPPVISEDSGVPITVPVVAQGVYVIPTSPKEQWDIHYDDFISTMHRKEDFEEAMKTGEKFSDDRSPGIMHSANGMIIECERFVKANNSIIRLECIPDRVLYHPCAHAIQAEFKRLISSQCKTHSLDLRSLLALFPSKTGCNLNPDEFLPNAILEHERPFINRLTQDTLNFDAFLSNEGWEARSSHVFRIFDCLDLSCVCAVILKAVDEPNLDKVLSDIYNYIGTKLTEKKCSLGTVLIQDVCTLCVRGKSIELAESLSKTGAINFHHLVRALKSLQLTFAKDSEDYEFAENVMRQAVGAQIQRLREQQGEEPEFEGWARPKAKFPKDPEIEEFLQSEEIEFRKQDFYGIDHARRWSRELRGDYNTFQNTDISPGGKGRTAYVIIKKKKDKKNAEFDRIQEMIEKLKVEYPYLLLAKRAR